MIVDYAGKNKEKISNKCFERDIILTGALFMMAVLTTVLLACCCYAPTQNMVASAEMDLIQLAGSEISLQNAPLWRLCALDGIGYKTAQEIVQQQMQ